MPLAAELDLPFFDYLDPSLSGERYREAMSGLRGHDGWLASGPYGFIVLGREAGELFLRTKSAVAVDRYRPAMRGFLAELVDAIPGDGRCELVAALAKPYPARVIAEVMGAPHEDAPRLQEWSNLIQRQFDAASLVADRERIERAVTELYEYEDALIARRRQAPGDDLISTLIAAEAAGDRLSDQELRDLILNILIGGVDTSQSVLVSAWHANREGVEPDEFDISADRGGARPLTFGGVRLGLSG
jgi:hypothetical protein